MEAAPPWMGSLRGTVQACSTLSIHGDIYYDVRLQVEDRVVSIRVPSHLCARPPVPPVRLGIELLMGQVVGAVFEASPDTGTAG